MKKNENKLTWEQLQQDERVYMPEGRFSKAYNTTMRYIVNKTNLQTAMLYYIIYSHYNHIDKTCFPSLETLSIEAGVSIKTIQTMLHSLKQAGIIDYKTGKKGKCNQYSFPLEEEKEIKKSKTTSFLKNNTVNNSIFDDDDDIF